MTRLEAIQYLIQERCNGSEWQEAGMWSATCQVMVAEESQFEGTYDEVGAWLETLIEMTRSY